MHLPPQLYEADILPRDEGVPPTAPPPPPAPAPAQLAARAPLPEPSTQSGESSNNSEVKTNVSVLPVVLGAGVPIFIAICILIYLHRRHVRRLRREDANDKHRSLDFGLDVVDAPSKGGGPMQEAEKGARVNHSKGMSLDINHPYLMPADLHASQESFATGDKPRHPDSVSTMSHPRGFQDDASSFKHPKSSLYMPSETTMNARRMSRASSAFPGSANGKDSGLHFDLPPPLPTSTGPNPFGDDDSQHESQHEHPHQDESLRNDHLQHSDDNDQRHYSAASSSGESDAARLRKSNAHLALAIDFGTTDLDPFKHPDELNESGKSTPVQEHAPAQQQHHLQSEEESAAAPAPQVSAAMPTPRISFPSSEAESEYSDHRKTNASIPAVNISGVDDDDDNNSNHGNDHVASMPQPPPVPEDAPSSEAVNNNRLSTRRDTRRMTFGLRPLPPDDPADNPEQRANRIRSFYKEYFDESKNGGAQRETYYEDYGPEYYPYPPEEMGYEDDYYDDYYYPPVPAPFAEPDGRRAMTPPPRAPPRFQGHMGSGSIGGFSGYSGGYGGMDNYYPGPRAMSSASNRLPGAPRGGAPRRPMPPPAPLNVLPTPHMLKDDAIMTAIDFAPAKNFSDQREGRPDSPFGGKRPFSPATRAATPLASSFNELAVMPSPHALRNSGAYSNLDFAPPSRFKTTETAGASDTGSIRSNGTGGMSNVHHWNIRNGAYRVSRLPTGTVGTKDDMFNELRPKWDMRA